MLRLIPFIALILALLLTARFGNAAFKSSKDASAPFQSSNPAPLDDDISLPMPCGVSLVLRPVAIPSGALIRDRPFAMGMANAGESDIPIYDKQFHGHISAPLTLQDLPEAWRPMLEKAANFQTDTWYFIGKYEITEQQWASVMNALDDKGVEDAAACPKPDKNASLPKTGISWFAIQEFLDRYNAWLLSNHPSDLPSFKDTSNIGFLRLPTEEEWEYAARGGARVPAEWWANQDVFPLAEGKSIADYGVYAQQSLSPIGRRNANPLGIHDALGNAAELVDGYFRLSIPELRDGRVERRLHGSAGGMLTKGGSFLSQSEEEILPGKRDEAPLYTSKGSHSRRDLGFRVLLSAINVPNAERFYTLRQEEKDIPLSGKSVPAISGSTPLEAVESLLESANGSMKDTLARLKDMISEREIAQAAQHARNLEHSLRSLLYQAETLRSFAFRYATVEGEVEKIDKMLAGDLDAENRARAEQVAAQGKKDLDDYLHTMNMGAGYYRNSLEAVSAEPRHELERLLAQFRREYDDNSVFGRHMEQNLDILQKYLDTGREKGLSAITIDDILKGIIPERHYRIIMKKN